MNRLYIFCGYPFAGKSTLAKVLKDKYGFISIEMNKIYKDGGGASREVDWEKTYKLYNSRIEENLLNGKTVIADTVGYNEKGRDGLRELAKINRAESRVVYVDTPLDIVKERLQRNKTTSERHDVSEAEFNNIVSNFEPPTVDENVIRVTPDINIEQIDKLFA